MGPQPTRARAGVRAARAARAIRQRHEPCNEAVAGAQEVRDRESPIASSARNAAIPALRVARPIATQATAAA